MVSGTLAPLYSFWVKVGLKWGSSPDRGQSPVEWRDFPSVRPSVCLSVHPSVRPFPPSRAQEPARRALDPSNQASEPARQAPEPASQAGSKACPAGSWALEGGMYGRTDVRTDVRTDGKPLHSTGLRPLSGPLPKKRASTQAEEK